MAPFRLSPGPHFRAQKHGLPRLSLSSSRSCPPPPNLASGSRGCAAGPVGLGRSQTSSSARRLCGRGQVTEPLCPSAPVSETGECDHPPEGL